MDKYMTVPKATLQRYPIYLKALRKLKENGNVKIMSKDLAKYVDIKSTTIRRDFSFLGNLGKQGYGYGVDNLIKIFSDELGIGFDEKIILIGAGNLGKAILNYNRWKNVVGEIVCAFDKFPDNKGDMDIPVYNINDLSKYIPEDCKIAILCISEDIQETVNKLVENGICGLVDFTHEHFQVPKHVYTRQVDVVSSIQEIVFRTNTEKQRRKNSK
ncbi:MAG: redox-sensing transcriptional repressor Rex [Anaerorhabdus sp.]